MRVELRLLLKMSCLDKILGVEINMKYPKQKHSITAWPKATLNTKKKMLQLISTFSPNTLNGLPR